MTCMTSDTRQVSKVFGVPKRYKDAENKVGRISPYCLFGGGGSTMLVDEIKNEVNGKGEYLDDFKPVLERAIARIKKKELYADFFESSEEGQILISGFNKDGSSGYLSFKTGIGEEVEYRKLDVHEQEFIIISPSDEERDAALSVSVMPPVNTFDELTQGCINYASQIQNAFFTNDEETVSETFNYSAIYKDPD